MSTADPFSVRAYFHRGVLKKCHLLFPAPVFAVNWGRITAGTRPLGLRQASNVFGETEMRDRIEAFREANPWCEEFFYDKSLRDIWVPEGLVIDALAPAKIMGPWRIYGEHTVFPETS